MKEREIRREGVKESRREGVKERERVRELKCVIEIMDIYREREIEKEKVIER